MENDEKWMKKTLPWWTPNNGWTALTFPWHTHHYYYSRIPPKGSHFQVGNEACRVSDQRKCEPESGIVSSHIIRQIIKYLCPTIIIISD
jgi:hypothetical protein